MTKLPNNYLEILKALLVDESDQQVIAEIKKQVWLLQQGISPPPPWEWLARHTKPHPGLGLEPEARWHVHYNEYGDPIALAHTQWGSPSEPTPIAPAAALKPPKLLQFPPQAESINKVRRGVWRGTYAEYTATPEFAAIASAARKEWNYQCLIDRNHKGRIEMHHRDYRNVPFGEDWRDLIPLCEDCHHLYHDRLLKPPSGLFDEIAPRKVA